MKRKIKKCLVLLTAVMGILMANTLTAFAYTDEAAAQEPQTEEPAPETPVVEETPVETEPEKETEATPFSVPGNGQLLDDKSNDDTKQFLTIQTKNGNTFFMVLDRSSNTENVYMLSMIDENDLAEFVEKTEAETPEVVLPETTPEPDKDKTEAEVKPEKTETTGMNTGAIAAIVLLLAGGIGGYYYFKVLKPKKEEETAEDENLEFFDGGAYINEDQNPSADVDADEEE